MSNRPACKEMQSPVRRPRKQYYCPKCAYTTVFRHDLRRHIPRHENAEHVCEECDMPFQSLGHLHAHKRNKHGFLEDASVKRILCPDCPYSTLQTGDFSKHKYKHKFCEFPCKLCNYPFCHPHPLRTHIKKEHGIIQSSSTFEILSSATVRIINNTKKKQSLKKTTEHTRNNHNNKIMDNVKIKTTEKTSIFHLPSSNKKEHKSVRKREILQLINDLETDDENTGVASSPEEKDKGDFSDTSSPPYKCTKCVFLTNDHAKFARHVAKHKKARYTCNVCKIPFLYDEGLTKHIKRKHNHDPQTTISSISSTSIIDKKQKRVMKCAFANCDFTTYSFAELKHHLELPVHEIEQQANNADVYCSSDDIPDASQHGSPEQVENYNEHFNSQTPAIRCSDDGNLSICNSDVNNAIRSFKEETLSQEQDSANVEHVNEFVKVMNDEEDDGTITFHPDDGRNNWDVMNDDDPTNDKLDDVVVSDSSTKEDSHRKIDTPLVGKLSKAEFKKGGKLFMKKEKNGHIRYTCLICERDNKFKTLNAITEHFESMHKNIRERVCATCAYCSGPFPKRKKSI